MREIKFRAWDMQRKKMYTHSEFMEFTLEFVGTIGQLANEISFGLDLQQSTGLFDKKGVEIYECDIVKSAQGKIAEVRINDCILEWNIYPSHHWKKDNVRTFGIMSKGHANLCEVIGNIYENPELLERK